MLAKVCQRLQCYSPPCIFSSAWKNNWMHWRENGREEVPRNDHSHCSRQNLQCNQHSSLDLNCTIDSVRSTQPLQPQIPPFHDSYKHKSKAQPTGSQDRAEYLCINQCCSLLSIKRMCSCSLFIQFQKNVLTNAGASTVAIIRIHWEIWHGFIKHI